MIEERPGWDEYFAQIACQVSSRSTCVRRKVGCVVVKERRILATGYNGAPTGLKHCGEAGCLRETLNVSSGERHELCRGLHAEQNAIIQAAIYGTPLEGSDIYSTHLPCVLCTKMLINVRVRRIFFLNGYPDDFAKKLIGESGIPLIEMRIENDRINIGELNSGE